MDWSYIISGVFQVEMYKSTILRVRVLKCGYYTNFFFKTKIGVSRFLLADPHIVMPYSKNGYIIA